MADFSHLRALPIKAYEARLRRNQRLTDEMFLAGLQVADPPLDVTQMSELVAELDPDQRRKVGRPKQNVPQRIQLAMVLKDAALPPLFRSALIARLMQGRRYTEVERSLAVHKLLMKRRRKVVIKGLYGEFRKCLPAADAIQHPVLGRIDTGDVTGEPRSHAAAILTQQIARDWLGLNPPSVGTIINIVRKLS